MRELKFRAWVDKKHKMLEDVSPFVVHVTGANEPLLSKGEPNEDCIFEQYTGLKDRNGKEIYEGDIIVVDNYKLSIPTEDKTEASEVFYSNSNAAFVYRTWYGERPVSLHDTSVEVIGNIHENKELLDE